MQCELNSLIFDSVSVQSVIPFPFPIPDSGFQIPSFSAAGYLTRLMSNISNRNKLQLMQII